MHRKTKLYRFVKEPTICDIRPDAVVGYTGRNGSEVAFVEAELSNKGLDISKYEKLFNSGEYRKYFSDFPKLIVVTDKSIPKTKLDVVTIKTSLDQVPL